MLYGVVVAVAFLAGWIAARARRNRRETAADAALQAEIDRLEQLIALERLRSHKSPEPQVEAPERWLDAFPEVPAVRPARHRTAS